MASIVVFADVILPNSLISAGVRGKLKRRNVRAEAPNGNKRVISRGPRTLRQYEWSSVPLRAETWREFAGLYNVTNAGANGFLMVDPTDATVAADEGLMYPYLTALVGAIGVGYGVPTYRLYKRDSVSGSTRTSDRRISRPQATPALLRGGAAVTLGASAGNAAINLDTGLVTFVADSSSTVTVVTVGASTVVTLTAALAGLAIGGRLYLLGLTGADAALLNGLSHAITNITGGGSNVYTLSTNTAGKTITASGSGYKYPQAAETLKWSGRFYVPVHFANDDIDWDLVAAGQEDARFLTGPNVLLDEVPEA